MYQVRWHEHLQGLQGRAPKGSLGRAVVPRLRRLAENPSLYTDQVSMRSTGAVARLSCTTLTFIPQEFCISI